MLTPSFGDAGEVGGWGHKTFAYLPHGTMEDVASQSSAEFINAVVASGGAPAAPRGDGSCGLITLHLSDNLFEGSTGCHEWEAGFLLAEIVLNNPEIVRGNAPALLLRSCKCTAYAS